MSPSSEDPGALDPRVNRALQEFLERKDRGETVDHEQFLAGHADIADQLRSFIFDSEDLARIAAMGSAPSAKVSMNQSLCETIAPVSPGALLVLPEVFGRYRLQRLLGRGAMGAVYLAHDTQLSRQVAIKVPSFDNGRSEDSLQRFYIEARAAATLRNPHICPVYDVGEIDGQHYISMAYIEGCSLSEVIKTNGPQSERYVLLLIRKLALALQEAHHQGIIHRDLKPGNVMIDTRGEPVVMDFGLACQTREGAARITLSGVILGSPAYMPPEQLEGNSAKISPAADQYSLGVILYELLTGQLPFRGSISAVVSQVVNKPAPSPKALRPDLDPRADQLCLQMLSKTPGERLTSMKAVAERIAAILKEPPSVEAAETARMINPPQATTKNVASSAAPRSTRPEQSRTVTPRTESSKSQGKAADARVNRQQLSTLCLLAAKLIRKHDYAEAVKVLSSVPVDSRTDELSDLLFDAEGKEEESNQLLKDVDLAIRTNRPKELPALVRRFLQLKPGNKAMQTLAKDLQTFGVDEVISSRRKRRDVLDPAGQVWNPLHLAYFVVGLGLFCLTVYFSTIAFSTPNGTVIIEIHDPRIAINFANDEVTAISSGRKFRLKTTDKKTLQLEIDGVVIDSSTQEISVASNETKLISARLIDGQVDLQVDSQKKTFRVNANPAPDGAGPQPPNGLSPALTVAWIDLFNGENLAGWEHVERASGRWVIRDHELVGGDNPCYLRTQKSNYSDFRLRAEVALAPGADGNLSIRSAASGSLQCKLRNEQRLSGGLYFAESAEKWEQVAIPTARELIPDQFFTIELVAIGPTVTVSVNGKPVSTWTDSKRLASRGHIELASHLANKPVRIRKIQIQDLSSAKALEDINPVPKSAASSPPSVETSAASGNRGKVLLDVDFRKSDGNFAHGDYDHVLMEHKDGEFRYLGKKSGWWHGGVHSLFYQPENHQLRDFVLEFDIRIISGKKGKFSINFGRSGAHQLNFCLNQAGQVQLLCDDQDLVPLTRSPVMRPVDQFNTIRLEVENKTVRVSVNGASLFEKRLERYVGDSVVPWIVPEDVPFDVRLQRIRFERLGAALQLSAEVRRFKGHTDIVRGVAFLPDGKRAVSVGHSQAFKLWDVTTGQLLYDFTGHSNHVSSVSVSSDGLRALTGCDDNLVRLWNLEKRTLLSTLKGHTAPIRTVLLSRDGLTGVSSSNDGTIRRWDLKTGKSVVLPGPAPDASLAISPNEDVVVAGNVDGSIVLRSKKGMATLTGHGPGKIEGLAFTSDGSKLISGADDGTVRVWDLDKGKEMHRFETDGIGFCSVALMNGGRYLMAGSRDSTIPIWDLQTGDLVAKIQADLPVTHRIALSPDNTNLLSGGGDIYWESVGDYDLHLWQVPSPPAPLPPAEPLAESKLTLLVDADFSKGLQGFSNLNDHQLKSGLVNQEWQYSAKQPPDWVGWGGDQPQILGPQHTDFVLEAEARWVTSKDQDKLSSWGLCFGFVKGVQDNRFIIGTDRKVWIQRWFNGDWSVPMESTPVPWMRPPTEFNTVRFEVEQGIARVFVNSRYVNQVRISQYQPGEVALMLFSQVSQPDIRFKRIRMWKLK